MTSVIRSHTRSSSVSYGELLRADDTATRPLAEQLCFPVPWRVPTGGAFSQGKARGDVQSSSPSAIYTRTRRSLASVRRSREQNREQNGRWKRALNKTQRPTSVLALYRRPELALTRRLVSTVRLSHAALKICKSCTGRITTSSMQTTKKRVKIHPSGFGAVKQPAMAALSSASRPSNATRVYDSCILS